MKPHCAENTALKQGRDSSRPTQAMLKHAETNSQAHLKILIQPKHSGVRFPFLRVDDIEPAKLIWALRWMPTVLAGQSGSKRVKAGQRGSKRVKPHPPYSATLRHTAPHCAPLRPTAPHCAHPVERRGGCTYSASSSFQVRLKVRKRQDKNIYQVRVLKVDHYIIRSFYDHFESEHLKHHVL